MLCCSKHDNFPQLTNAAVAYCGVCLDTELDYRILQIELNKTLSPEAKVALEKANEELSLVEEMIEEEKATDKLLESIEHEKAEQKPSLACHPVEIEDAGVFAALEAAGNPDSTKAFACKNCGHAVVHDSGAMFKHTPDAADICPWKGELFYSEALPDKSDVKLIGEAIDMGPIAAIEAAQAEIYKSVSVPQELLVPPIPTVPISPLPGTKLRCKLCLCDVEKVSEPWEGYAHIPTGSCPAGQIDPMTEANVEAYVVEAPTEFDTGIGDALDAYMSKDDAQVKIVKVLGPSWGESVDRCKECKQPVGIIDGGLFHVHAPEQTVACKFIGTPLLAAGVELVSPVGAFQLYEDDKGKPAIDWEIKHQPDNEDAETSGDETVVLSGKVVDANGDQYDPAAMKKAIEEFSEKHGGKFIKHADGSMSVYGPVPEKEKEKGLSDDEYKKLVIQKFAKKIEGGWKPVPAPGLFIDQLKLPTPVEKLVPMTLKEGDELFKEMVKGGSAISMNVSVGSKGVVTGSHIDAETGEEVKHITVGPPNYVSLVDGGLDKLKGLELSSLSEDDMDLIFPTGIEPVGIDKLKADLIAVGVTTDPEDDDEIQDTGMEPAYGISHDD